MSSTVEELVAQLRDGGSRVTTARRLVLTALVQGVHHPTAEELLVAGRKYWTAGGALNTLRESQSHLNTPAGRGELAAGDG